MLVLCIAFPLFTSLLLGIIFEWVYGYTNTSLHAVPQKPREQKEIYIEWYLTSTKIARAITRRLSTITPRHHHRPMYSEYSQGLCWNAERKRIG